jgi:hypothetical protein
MLLLLFSVMGDFIPPSASPGGNQIVYVTSVESLFSSVGLRESRLNLAGSSASQLNSSSSSNSKLNSATSREL